MSNVSPRSFGTSNIATGATNSQTGPVSHPAAQGAKVAEGLTGVISIYASKVVNKKGKVVRGQPTNKGFFYAAESIQEHKAEFERLVEKGQAYVYSPSAG